MAALNHIIIPAKDKEASATFLADILGVKAGPQWGPFRPVQTSNGVTLDFVDSKDVRTQHYAFLVDDERAKSSVAQCMACQPGLVSIRIQVSGANWPMNIGPSLTLMAGPVLTGL